MNKEFSCKNDLSGFLKGIGEYKLIVPCAGSKIDNIKAFHGKNFVAKAAKENEVRPFDEVEGGKTWYDLIREEQNSPNLEEASKLYTPPMFKTLTKSYENRRKDLYILSAGWGIVRSITKLPLYNITFSANGNITQSRKISGGERNMGRDSSKDWRDAKEFNELLEDISSDENKPIVFVGGKSYFHRFYYLMTQNHIKNPIYILYSFSGLTINEKNWTLCKINKDMVNGAATNWHYQLADLL